MISVHPKPSGSIGQLQVQGLCPHCHHGTTYTLVTYPASHIISEKGICHIVMSYACDLCLQAIPVSWIISQADQNNIQVIDPKEVLPVRESYSFEHVPHEVEKEIKEALDCLSVGAYNGFAAVCRRVIQEICTNIGVPGTPKIKQQIEETVELIGLNKEWRDLMLQVMLYGHDGSHPHLPEMNFERATILLHLLKDLTYQIYTRPGKIKDAARLRQEAIDSQRNI